MNNWYDQKEESLIHHQDNTQVMVYDPKLINNTHSSLVTRI